MFIYIRAWYFVREFTCKILTSFDTLVLIEESSLDSRPFGVEVILKYLKKVSLFNNIISDVILVADDFILS